MKNIFICHRPYHVLRSADIIQKKFLEDNNILVKYDIVNIKTNKYQHFKVEDEIKSYFNEIIEISRCDDVRIWAILKYLNYQRSKELEYKEKFNSYFDFDNVFFFSDLEKPIEILVGILKENKKEQSNIYIVDEGLATYYRTRTPILCLFKLFVKYFFRIKYINKTTLYGGSNLYDIALACIPEKAFFKKPIVAMSSISPIVLKSAMGKNDNIDLQNKYILYLSSVLEQTLNVPQNEELIMLEKLYDIAKALGYNFYIKPHPVQSANYYTVSSKLKKTVIETTTPAEILMSENCVVASAASSALVNAYFLHLRIIELSSILHRKSFTNKVISLFSPDNYQQIEDYLRI